MFIETAICEVKLENGTWATWQTIRLEAGSVWNGQQLTALRPDVRIRFVDVNPRPAPSPSPAVATSDHMAELKAGPGQEIEVSDSYLDFNRGEGDPPLPYEHPQEWFFGCRLMEGTGKKRRQIERYSVTIRGKNYAEAEQRMNEFLKGKKITDDETWEPKGVKDGQEEDRPEPRPLAEGAAGPARKAGRRRKAN